MFKDRKEAGILLAGKLTDFAGQSNLLVFALPRGGVVTAAEIAGRLNAPLDVFIVRKIGHPLQPELAVGAISETGTVVYNEDVVASYGVTRKFLSDEAVRQREEILRRQHLYRRGEALADVRDKKVILVDDGVATGATMKAAIMALRREQIAKLIVAVPVAPPETAAELRSMADLFVCLETPEYFTAVGSYYYEFQQITDEEVTTILDDFRDRRAA